ncbi:MAG TPA: AAA family ATPase [Kofleriaceae bacterium]|nr:AAA family ATPase [Kofleriaceae bacterium]
MLAFPPFRLDVAEQQLWRGARLLPLRRKPFAILRYLAENPRRLVTQDELLKHVWGATAVSESAVRTHLHELRQALGEGVIETVIGRGYRFTVEPSVETVAPEPREVDANLEPERIVVGRGAELATLRAAFERAATGHRQLCFVTGEPGIGKTTLVDTFVGEVEGRPDVAAVRGQCIEQHGSPEALAAVIEVLAQLRRSQLGERALAALVRYAPTFVAQIPHLVPDAQLEDVARRARGGAEQRSVRELIEALEALCAEHTIVVVLEDLQWSDVATIDLLALLGQRRERARLMVVATSRRAEAQTVTHPLNRVMRALIARAGAIAIPLERIAADEVRRLVDMQFPDHQFPAALIATIDHITAGTPLFVVSFLEDLVGQRMLEQRAGAWQLTVPIDDVAAHRPDSVRQLIDIQLDRLAPEEQRLLEAASVIGIEFPTALVAAALEASVEHTDEICDGLARRALFLRRGGTEEWPDGTVQPRYCVTHGLVQEVCLGRIAGARRQRWHRRIAERLDAAYGERAAEIALALAAHHDHGGSAKQAIHYYRLAAERTTLRFANRDALALFERAHTLMRRLPATPERDALELSLLAGKTQSVIRSSATALRSPAEAFEEMIALARRLGDAPTLSAALANLSLRLAILAQYERSEAVGKEFDELRRATPLAPDVVSIDTTARALIASWRGEIVPAIDILERGIRDAGGLGVIPGIIGSTDLPTLFGIQLSFMRWLLGEPTVAEREAQRASERATRLGDPYMSGHAYCSLARLAFLGRRPAHDVREPAQRALAIRDAEVWHPQATLLIGYADSLDHPLGGPALDELVRQFRARTAEVPIGATYMGLLVASVSIRSGDSARARPVIDEMLQLARATGERIVEPELVRLRGQLLEPSEPEAAAAAYREAISLGAAQQSRAFQLRAANSLAALCRTGEGRVEALARVAEALAPFHESTPDVVDARQLLAEAGR